ncbi:hypothetical protein AB205_0174010, partial [Aquarana catesbeiana]
SETFIGRQPCRDASPLRPCWVPSLSLTNTSQASPNWPAQSLAWHTRLPCKRHLCWLGPWLDTCQSFPIPYRPRLVRMLLFYLLRLLMVVPGNKVDGPLVATASPLPPTTTGSPAGRTVTSGWTASRSPNPTLLSSQGNTTHVYPDSRPGGTEHQSPDLTQINRLSQQAKGPKKIPAHWLRHPIYS